MYTIRHQRSILLLVTILAVGFAAGCERSELQGTGVPELPSVEQLEAAMEAMEVERDGVPGASDLEPGPPLSLASWPGRDGRHTFGMTWLGGQEEVVLRLEPDADSDVAATTQWVDGAEIDWRDTRQIVTLPWIYKAREAGKFTGYTYETEHDLTLDEAVEVGFGKDDLIRIYGDAGEGQCYVGKGEAFFLVDCMIVTKDLERLLPLEIDDTTRPWKPEESQWWVLVEEEGKRGWWRVDESRVEVRAVPMTTD
ncbi:MAG: hypothetical protein ACNA8W_09765 [Bradymonadaceae bacterium]